MTNQLRDQLSDEAFALLKLISTAEFHSFYLNEFEDYNAGEEVDVNRIARCLEFFAGTFLKKSGNNG